jgi:membrane fusion protein, heavy metal efflux system
MNRKLSTIGIILTLALTSPLRVAAHEGHDKAPGEGGEVPASGPIAISAEAKRNLALVVEEAELRTLEKTFMVIGQIEAIPTREAAVTSRIPGRVSDLKVVDGQTVKKGQVLVEVESRQLGDPPPRVQFTAPVDGIVTDLHVRPCANVEPDAHLMEIVDLSEVYAEGRVFEGQIARVKTGQKVRVYVESFPKHVFTGTVDLVSGSLDPQTRTLKVMARVENLEWKLRPNMRARMHVVEAEAESAVTIPHSAVLGDAGHYFVFVQSDTDELVYEKKPVVLGLKDDRHFEVIEGVFPTDKVVVDGNYQLQYVTARRPAATPATSGDGTNAVAAAGGPGEHGASTGAGHSHGGMFGSPLFWMGAALTLMLLANVIVLLIKRRQPAVTDHLVEVEPPSSAAEKVRGSRIAHETAK